MQSNTESFSSPLSPKFARAPSALSVQHNALKRPRHAHACRSKGLQVSQPVACELARAPSAHSVQRQRPQATQTRARVQIKGTTSITTSGVRACSRPQCPLSPTTTPSSDPDTRTRADQRNYKYHNQWRASLLAPPVPSNSARPPTKNHTVAPPQLEPCPAVQP